MIKKHTSSKILLALRRLNSLIMLLRGLIVRPFLALESKPCRLKVGRGLKFNSLCNCCFGRNVTISRFTWLNAVAIEENYTGIFSIGDNSYIGNFCHINFINKVCIGDDVSIADRVFISDCSHIFSNLDIPISKQGVGHAGDVFIENGAWIGEGACIMPGVTIGRNAVVGANAVVTKNIPDYSIAVGVPAKIINPLRN
jgi:acetyltransferase-like isoleucine patch superfamily enzyme